MDWFNGNGHEEIIDYEFQPIDKTDGSLDVIKISKRFGEPLHRCFCRMSPSQIELFLEIISFDENHRIWTWKKLKELTAEIIYDKNYTICKQCLETDFDDYPDKIVTHHVHPRSRFGRDKEKRKVKMNRSQRFENSFHHCFWHMTIQEIVSYLEKILDANNDEIWTWEKLKRLRKEILQTSVIDTQENQTGIVIPVYKDVANFVPSAA